VARLVPGLAQMWLRDHTLFAWCEWQGEGRIAQENLLRQALQPWFNTSKTWTRYAAPFHEHHDLTLPIEPRRLEGD
jgi:hypothetical protein